MDIKPFTYILQVANLGSITKAANTLFVSQPYLSTYISKVEEELGTPIFNRSTNPISLTKAGELYIQTAAKMVNLDKEMRSALVDLAECKKGRIVLGIPTTHAIHMLPPLLKKFWETYPNIEVQNVEVDVFNIKESLLKGTCDIAILPNSLSDENLEWEILFRDELVLLADKDLLRLVGHPKKGFADLAKLKVLPFVMLKKGYYFRNILDEVLLNQGFEPNVIFETSSFEMTYKMAFAGLGITASQSKFAETIPDNIAKLRLESQSQAIIAFRKDANLNHAQQDMITYIKHFCKLL